MAVIDIKRFGPVVLDGRRLDLPDDAALSIQNVRTGGDRLESISAPTILSAVWPDQRPPLTRRPYIYRTGTHSNDDARVWALDAGADIERTPVQGDWEDRIVITGWQRVDDDPYAPATGAPKTVSKTIAAATSPDAFEPSDFNYLGVPAPSVAPVLTGVTPNAAVVITEIEVGNLLLSRTMADIPNRTASGYPGDGDTSIGVDTGANGEHIYGGFLPGQRCVVTEVLGDDYVRIAAPNADRSLGELNSSSAWYFTPGTSNTQIIHTWRLPKVAKAKIVGHKLKVNDVLRVTEVSVNPTWFSTSTMTLAPSSGLERTAVPASGTITFAGKVSCVAEDPSLPVVYDNDGVLIASAAPSPLDWKIASNVAGSDARTCTATPYGGTGPYTYAWTWASGGTGLTTAGTTTSTITVTRTFTQMENATYTGTLRCTITDNVAATSTVDVPVRVAVSPTGGVALTVTAAPSPATASADSTGGSGNLDRTVTATPAGGLAAYSYTWSWAAGGTGLSLVNPSTATVTVRRAYAQYEGATYTGTLRCTVTDALGSSVYVDVPVTFTVAGALLAAVSPTALTRTVYTSVPGGGTSNFTVTGTPTGGTGPYTYAWTWASGGTGLTLVNASSATVTVRKAWSAFETGTYSGTLRCTITDSAGTPNVAYDDAHVLLVFESLL